MEQPTSLTVQQAAHFRAVANQIATLRQAPIATQHNDAQIAALAEELVGGIMPHIDDLLEAFLLVKHEYEPIVQANALILRRAQEVNAAYMARRFQQQQVEKAKADIVAQAASNTPGEAVKPADNIIVLEQPKSN